MSIDPPDVSIDPVAAAVDRQCRLQGEFIARSGQVLTEYFDKYLFEGDPGLLRQVAERMVPLLPAERELLGGLELGGIPIVTVLSQLTMTPAVFVRKKAKEHGTCKLAEGGEVEGRRVVLVEDVITTGGAVIDGATALRERGAMVDLVICAIDRRPADASGLDDARIEVRSAFTWAQLAAAQSSGSDHGHPIA